MAAERIVATVGDGLELAAAELGYKFAALMGLDLVVVAVDHQYGTVDLAIHRLGDVERGRDAPCLDGPDQHRAAGVVGPLEAILDLLGRMWRREDVFDKMLGEVRIVA